MANFRGHLARRNRCQPLRRRSFRVCSGSWANYVLALGALVVLLGSSAVAHWAGHRYASVHVPVAGASWRGYQAAAEALRAPIVRFMIAPMRVASHLVGFTR